MYASPIARLVQQLAKLPGIGEKTAARLAFHIIRAAPDDAAALAAAITDVKQRIRFCGVCWDLTERDPCALCADARRDAGLVCVVAHPQDVAAVERTGGYRGRYHVLHGLLSPLDGIGPDELNIGSLIARVKSDQVREVIVATNATVDGQTTAHYLAERLAASKVPVTRLAHGVPVGGELDWLDDGTLATALKARRAL